MLLYCIYANNCTEQFNWVPNRDENRINYIRVELNIIYIYPTYFNIFYIYIHSTKYTKTEQPR